MLSSRSTGVKIRSRLFFGIKKLLPHATVRKEPVETDRLQAELITDGKLEYAVLGISAVEDLGQSPVIARIDDDVIEFIRSAYGDGQIEGLGIYRIIGRSRYAADFRLDGSREIGRASCRERV